jgi:hypothetical protein
VDKEPIYLGTPASPQDAARALPAFMDIWNKSMLDGDELLNEFENFVTKNARRPSSDGAHAKAGQHSE